MDKKLFSELQAQYCAVPDSGKCPCYNVGDEFMFYRNDERDDYWHMGAGTLIKSGKPDEGVLLSPGTMHCGTDGVPFCSEAWDAISRYIYSALQGGAIMHGWMNDDKVMITCCNDGWKAFRIQGVLDFSLIGILAKIATVLADNGISIFAVSTYNTDYVLIKKENYQKALDILQTVTS